MTNVCAFFFFFRNVTENEMCIDVEPSPPTVSRLNTVLQAAGMFQKCFLLFFLGGLHRDTGDTD